MEKSSTSSVANAIEDGDKRSHSPAPRERGGRKEFCRPELFVFQSLRPLASSFLPLKRRAMGIASGSVNLHLGAAIALAKDLVGTGCSGKGLLTCSV